MAVAELDEQQCDLVVPLAHGGVQRRVTVGVAGAKQVRREEGPGEQRPYRLQLPVPRRRDEHVVPPAVVLPRGRPALPDEVLEQLQVRPALPRNAREQRPVRVLGPRAGPLHQQPHVLEQPRRRRPLDGVSADAVLRVDVGPPVEQRAQDVQPDGGLPGDPPRGRRGRGRGGVYGAAPAGPRAVPVGVVGDPGVSGGDVQYGGAGAVARREVEAEAGGEEEGEEGPHAVGGGAGREEGVEDGVAGALILDGDADVGLGQEQGDAVPVPAL